MSLSPTTLFDLGPTAYSKLIIFSNLGALTPSLAAHRLQNSLTRNTRTRPGGAREGRTLRQRTYRCHVPRIPVRFGTRAISKNVSVHYNFLVFKTRKSYKLTSGFWSSRPFENSLYTWPVEKSLHTSKRHVRPWSGCGSIHKSVLVFGLFY